MYPNQQNRNLAQALPPIGIQNQYRKAACAVLSDSLPPTLEDESTSHGNESTVSGQGVVICGGGPSYFVQAWVAIRTLRALGCELPIELWHLGESEMTPTMRSLIEPLNVRCRDAIALAASKGWKRLEGWAIKPFAILYSQFSQVLYLDSDCVPARDPSGLFADPSFQRYGSLFWTDRYRGSGSPFPTVRPNAWPACNVPIRDEAECESGQMLIDRNRLQLELRLTLHFNQHADYYYQFLYGDKDTFRLAWHRLGRHFNTVPYGPSSPVGFRVLYHFDPQGQLVFQHRARSKWSLDHANPQLPGFVHGKCCERYLSELRSHWHLILNEFANAACPDFRKTRERVLQQSRYRCWIGERQPISIQLNADGTVDANHRLIPSHWQIAEQPCGDFNLSLMGDRAAPLSLQWKSDRWMGRRMAGTRPPIELIPAASVDSPPSMQRSDDYSPLDRTGQPTPYFDTPSIEQQPGKISDDEPIAEPYESKPEPKMSDTDMSKWSMYIPNSSVGHDAQLPVASYDESPRKSVVFETPPTAYDHTVSHSASISERGVREDLEQERTEIKIHGLPRCCTNLVTVLLRRQFHTNVYANQLGWKHGSNLHCQGDQINGRPLRFIVCVKHPYSWLASFYRFDVRANGNPATFREFVMGKCRTYAEQNPIERFNVLNRIWLGMGTSPAFLQLIQSEIMQSNQVGQLRLLETQFRLRRRTARLRPASRRVGPDEQIRARAFDSTYYDESRFMQRFDDELLSFVNQNLDQELVERLGYQLCSSVSEFTAPTQESIVHNVTRSMANGPI